MAEVRYRCTMCGREFGRDEVRYLCPACSSGYHFDVPLPGVLSAVFDYDAIRKRFDPARPDWNLFSAVEERYYPPFPVGNTPFFRAGLLAAETGFTNLWVKNDGLNPSGSLKDRASFLVVAEANRLNSPTIVTASTGNAASALAAVCAASGKKAIIFVPEKAPKAKLVQIILYGAQIVPVRGTYDDAFRLSIRYTTKRDGLNRNTAYHPLTIEGKKSAGFEIWQQNGGRAPDAIIVPVGDGVILAAVHKAFCDLRAVGLIERLPRLIAVQAEGSAVIHRYLTGGVCAPEPHPTTIADSISVSIPSNAHLAKRAIEESGGCSVTVSDEEIVSAQRLLARTTGVFAEPAAAAGLAGLCKLRHGNTLAPNGQVVLLVTGHGLKDIDVPLRNIVIPPSIDPDDDTFSRI